jgi:tetratricopeptide (TPR) repeat protein
VPAGDPAGAKARTPVDDYTAPTTPVRRQPPNDGRLPHDRKRRRTFVGAAAAGAVLVAAISWYAVATMAPAGSPASGSPAPVQPPAPEPVPPAPVPVPPAAPPPIDRGDPPGQVAAPPGQAGASGPPSAEPPQAPAFEQSLKAAQVYESVRNFRGALQEYDAVLKIAPDLKAAVEGRQRVRAALAEQAERTTRARALVRRASDRYEAGDYQAAIADLRQALDLVPQLTEATTLLTKVERARAAEANVRKRPGD